jgi:hypothetical protein
VRKPNSEHYISLLLNNLDEPFGVNIENKFPKKNKMEKTKDYYRKDTMTARLMTTE